MQVPPAVIEIGGREQELRDRRAVVRELGFVHPHQARLADGGERLGLGDRARRPGAEQAARRAPERDRAARHDDRSRAGRGQARDAAHERGEDGPVDAAALAIEEHVRADLDHPRGARGGR